MELIARTDLNPSRMHMKPRSVSFKPFDSEEQFYRWVATYHGTPRSVELKKKITKMAARHPRMTAVEMLIDEPDIGPVLRRSIERDRIKALRARLGTQPMGWLQSLKRIFQSVTG